jgi:hypothetical protein
MSTPFLFQCPNIGSVVDVGGHYSMFAIVPERKIHSKNPKIGET